MKNFLKKYREIIAYVIFGGLTTAVNYIIYFPLRHYNVNYIASLVSAWVGAVLFAYVTNRIFVFKSKTRGARAFSEFLLFVGARVFSLGADAFIMFMFISVAHIGRFVITPSFAENPLPAGEFIARTVAQAVIVILNFVFSKLVIFKKKK